ncbi:interleukin-1 receptor-like 1 [Arapaima gigas]
MLCISLQLKHEDPCEFYEEDPLYVTEGEAVRMPLLSEDGDTKYVWHNEEMQEIGMSEDNRVHHHGEQLYFLPILLNDSGVFRRTSETCDILLFKVKVVKAEPFNQSVLYMPIEEKAVNPRVTCPNDMWQFCEDVGGNFTWYKDFRHIPKESGESILILNASKQDEGVYTCSCTWKHGGRIFNSSASRKLILKGECVTVLLFQEGFMFCVPGSKARLVCSVFIGFNVQDHCIVQWAVNGTLCVVFYYRNTEHNVSVCRTTLTVCKVSEEHFHTKFKCLATNSNKWDCVFVSLKHPKTMYQHVVVTLALLAIFILALGSFKFFLIDVVLLTRQILKTFHSQEDGKVFDAYIIYQKNDIGKAAAEQIFHFVEKVLPQELEQKWGYRLFIQGRDDLPGEDVMELVPTRVGLSRRLLIILTPAAQGSCVGSMSEMYGPPAGLALHQALVQDELKVILIELQSTGTSEHLPSELQHLVRKSTPLLWECQGFASRRFWKRVRYMMPPPP